MQIGARTFSARPRLPHTTFWFSMERSVSGAHHAVRCGRCFEVTRQSLLGSEVSKGCKIGEQLMARAIAFNQTGDLIAVSTNLLSVHILESDS
jgi:hypothetical protein